MVHWQRDSNWQPSDHDYYILPVHHCGLVCPCIFLWKNCQLVYSFWALLERDFIFGMHTQLMNSLKWRQACNLDLFTENSHFGLCCTGAFMLHMFTHTSDMTCLLGVKYRLCCHQGHSCFKVICKSFISCSPCIWKRGILEHIHFVLS